MLMRNGLACDRQNAIIAINIVTMRSIYGGSLFRHTYRRLRLRHSTMNLKAHEKIVRDALGDGNRMSSQALSWVIVANKRSDLYQFTPGRHFDNAPNREAICKRWSSGLN